MSKNRAHLTPTPITNKNGVPTTVYTKPAPLVTVTTMPAPALPQDVHQTRQEITTRLQETYERMQDKLPYPADYIRKALYSYSNDDLRALNHALKDPSLAEGITQQIVNTEPDDFIMDTIHFHRKTSSSNYGQTMAELCSMDYYDDFNMHDKMRNLDEHTQQQCIALMTFPRFLDGLPDEPSSLLSYLIEHETGVSFINDQDIVDLIASRPGDAERIANIILQYGTTDTATIHGILEGAMPSIAEGQL